MEKASWTDRVRKVGMLPTDREERDIVHRVDRGKANWIGHILRENCFVKQLEERWREGNK